MAAKIIVAALVTARQATHLVRDFGPLGETTRTGRVACVGPGTRYASARGKRTTCRMNRFSTGSVGVVVGNEGTPASTPSARSSPSSSGWPRHASISFSKSPGCSWKINLRSSARPRAADLHLRQRRCPRSQNGGTPWAHPAPPTPTAAHAVRSRTRPLRTGWSGWPRPLVCDRGQADHDGSSECPASFRCARLRTDTRQRHSLHRR